MSKYTYPKQSSSALISIDVQNDFTLIGAPAKIQGTHEKVPQMLQLLNAFRAANRPIVHVIRLYLPDGRNVDTCRKEMIEDGIEIAAPGTTGAELGGLLLRSLYKKQETAPFIWTILLFLLSFLGLVLIIFPYVIPPSITIYQAAASPIALTFMIIFIGFLIPIMLFYNIYNYVVFRGKVTSLHED